MASIWYIGKYEAREALGFRWNEKNGWSVPRADFTPDQIATLAMDSGFWTTAPDGPRVASEIPGYNPSTPPNPSDNLIAQLQTLVGTAKGLSTAQDSAVADILFDEDSESREVLNGTYAPVDRGEVSQDWAHFGDSMTGAGSSGSWVTKLAAVTGRNHYNGGIGGQSVSSIAARQGGVPALVTLVGNSIPASGVVPVEVISRTPIDPSTSITGTLSGVAGTLSRDTGVVHTFTRATAGVGTVCVPGTPFVPDVAKANRNRKFTLSAGRNGFKNSTPESIVGAIRSMRDYSTSAQGFVLDVPPWVGEELPAAPGSSREALNKLNAMLKAEFPSEFLNVFELLRTPAAAQAAGIFFSADDQTDITNGITPRSFRTDGGHLNEQGGKAVAYFVQKATFERGLIQTAPAAFAPIPGSITNLVKAPDPGVSPGWWNGNGGAGFPTSTADVVYTIVDVTGAPRAKAARVTGVAGMAVQPLISVGGTTTNRAVVEAGKAYTVSAYVRPSKAMTMQIKSRTYTATQSTDHTSGSVSTPANEWTRISYTFTPQADAISSSPGVVGTGGILSDQSYIEATAFMITEGPTLYPYGDGASPGWTWSAGAGVSSSSGPVLV